MLLCLRYGGGIRGRESVDEELCIFYFSFYLVILFRGHC